MKINGKYMVSSTAVFMLLLPLGIAQKPKENKVDPEKIITICHHLDDFQTHPLTIPISALNVHLAHGDNIGECPPENSKITLTLHKTDVKCNGGSDGSVTLDIQFSQNNNNFQKVQSQFNIIWSNGETTRDIFNLSAGTYSVTVSDSKKTDSDDNDSGYHECLIKDKKNKLFATASITINEPTSLLSDWETKNISCAGVNDGELIVYPQGGTSPYSIVWSGNGGTLTSFSVENLSTGVYQATVTDSNNCLLIVNIPIKEPLPLEIEFSVVNESCTPGNDGSSSALVSGGTPPYKYQWDMNANSQTNPMAINLGSGTYLATVFDFNGCNASKFTSISKEKCESKLRDEDCGATMASLSQVIFCNPVPGATNYQWEFSIPQSAFSITIQRGFALNNFYLTWVTGIQYGKTYEVRIKPFINGEWKDYGPACQISTPESIPKTRVRLADCGLTTTTLGQVIFCNMVAGALNYQWEFSNSDMGFHELVYRGNNALTFTIGWVPGILYGKTYDVRVRANVGGEWGMFGDVCQVSVVYPIPITKVRYLDCGKTLTAMTQFIYCDAVAGATDFQWEISNNDLNFLEVYQRNAPSTNFQFAWMPGIAYSTTYNIRVRAQVAGEWAAYGSTCQVTSPNAPIAPKLGNTFEEETVAGIAEGVNKLSVFPNPSKGETVKIFLSGYENQENSISLEVYDILGNKVFGKYSINPAENNLIAEINRNNELPSGIYILNVIAENKKQFERIIIK